MRDVVLKSGRVVTHLRPKANGHSEAVMLDGGPMLEGEWEEYCLLRYAALSDNQVLRQSLRTLIDLWPLRPVLGTIADICYDKAEDIKKGRPGRNKSKRWEHAGDEISSLAASECVRRVP